MLTVALLGLAAAGLVAGAGFVAGRAMTADTQAALRLDLTALQREYAQSGLGALARNIEARLRAPGPALFLLTDGTGQRHAGNLATMPANLGSTGAPATFTYPAAGNAGSRLAIGVLVMLDGGGGLVVARDIDEQRRLIASLTSSLAIGLVVLGVLGLVAGTVLARHILGRIDTVSATSKAIMAGDLSGRVPRTGSDDELDRLAGQLNAMLERIEQLMAGLREVSDNIAHDLRTPLNRLRNRAEAALADQRGAPAWREGLERTLDEADDLIKTFNALLLIARLDAGAAGDAAEVVDLAQVVADVAELYAPVMEDAGLDFAVETTGVVPARVNRQLVGQAIANLIDNALKYAVPAAGAMVGRGAIRIRAQASGASAQISVADRGPGIGPHERELALRRFGRLQTSRSQPGTGLGLSLVAAVARMHGGAMRLEDNAPGLRVVVEFPLAEAVAVMANSGLEVGTTRTEVRT